MFQIQPPQKPNDPLAAYLLQHPNGSKASIYPHLGASVQQLQLGDHTIINNIIEEDGSQKLLNSSGSAILFPFANRIQHGKYQYKGKNYQLSCNDPTQTHAIHGLVYKASFEATTQITQHNLAQITFAYAYQPIPQQGYPFPFELAVTYILWEDKLELQVKVQNTGDQNLPFNLGWHPYFWSTDLTNSQVLISTAQQVLVDDSMIPNGLLPYQRTSIDILKEADFLDTGYILTDEKVTYQSPDFELSIYTKAPQLEQHNYLQIYTPKHGKSVAIEPMTGAADCFNNQWGLQELEAGATYDLTWVVALSQPQQQS